MKATQSLVLLLAVTALLAGTPATAETINKELPASPGETLVFDLDSGGSIDITGWSRDAVAVSADLRRGGAQAEVEIERFQNGVRVSSKLRTDGNSSTSFHFTVQVPDRYNIEIETMGGSVSIDGVEGEIGGTTMGGKLVLRNLRGELQLTTMGGPIDLRDSEVDGKVTTMGGEVHMVNLYGDIKGTSMGGEVILKNVTRRDGSSTGDEVIISTMGGDIDVDDAPAGADLHTMGGDIRIASASEFIKAKTMGGDIRIDAAEGWIEATTMAGDVQVTVIGSPDREGRGITLTSMSGELRLTVPDGFPMEIDIELSYTKSSKRSYKIVSDFPISQQEDREWSHDKGSPRKTIHGTGSVGNGGPRIILHTINGNVHLQKGG